jgi:large subunit ribosomal protein L25
MSQTFQLNAETRTVVGKKVRALRREGLVTGAIYRRGKESLHVQLPYTNAVKIFHEAGKNHIVNLHIKDGSKHTVLIERDDREPVKNRLLHLAFQEVKKGEKVTAEVPVVLVGEAPATQMKLMVIEVTSVVEVTAEAANLPDHFEVDQSSLIEDGDSITVADLKVPADAEVQTPLDTVIVRVETPRAEVEAAQESEESTDAADVPTVAESEAAKAESE